MSISSLNSNHRLLLLTRRLVTGLKIRGKLVDRLANDLIVLEEIHQSIEWHFLYFTGDELRHSPFQEWDFLMKYLRSGLDNSNYLQDGRVRRQDAAAGISKSVHGTGANLVQLVEVADISCACRRHCPRLQ